MSATQLQEDSADIGCRVSGKAGFWDHGILSFPLAEVARQVGVSASATCKALNRTMKNRFNSVNKVPRFSQWSVWLASGYAKPIS